MSLVANSGDSCNSAGLTYTELATYNRDGYVVLRSRFSPDEVAGFQEEAKRLLMREDLIHETNWRTYFRKFSNGTWILEKFDPVIDISPLFLQLSRDPRVVAPVKQVLNDDNIFLFKDKLIFKLPGQDGYPLHQDYNWWHKYPPSSICTIVFAIDDSDANNGAIEFYKGCHHSTLLPDGAYRELSDEEAALIDGAEVELVELSAGDMVIFHSLTPHCSARNMSTKSRRNFYPSYCSSDVGDIYEAHQMEHRARLAEKVSPFMREKMYFE